MRSLLYQDGATPFEEPPGCAANPCRTEVPIRVRKDGRLYSFVLRDKVIPEDPYLVMVKARAFSISQNEPYAGKAPNRSVRDFLIKSSIII